MADSNPFSDAYNVRIGDQELAFILLILLLF
ncbi:BnaC04g02710D, partial [Brassica napus]